MVLINIRAVLQILLQGIHLKPKRMPMAKLYLLKGWSQGGWPTLFWAGVGGRSTYHKKVNKSLSSETKNHLTTHQIHTFIFYTVIYLRDLTFKTKSHTY
jgi:hypothetical protein